jgi:prepilin-type N-terminal cleavage/methylation domain-containing protein
VIARRLRPAKPDRSRMDFRHKVLFSRPSCASGGFTLLEVAISLAILAIAFTALSTLQARNLTLAAEDRTLTEATLAARDVLADLQSGIISPENAEGDLGQEHPGWRWMVRVDGRGPEALRLMEITVFEERGRPEKGVSFWMLVRKEKEQ